MSSLFQSSRNKRAILPHSMRYIRSDIPEKITADETGWLLDNNVRTIIDLRETEELAKKVCPLQGDDWFTYFSIPVTGGNAVPKCADDVPLSYIRMAASGGRQSVMIFLG